MLKYDRIDMSERINADKNRAGVLFSITVTILKIS